MMFLVYGKDMTVKKNIEIRKEEEVVLKFAGFWKDDRTTEEIIDDIYSSRTIDTSFLESLDE